MSLGDIAHQHIPAQPDQHEQAQRYRVPLFRLEGLAGELSRLVASPATWLELVLEHRGMEVFFSGYTACHVASSEAGPR
jgi:hypothetical protein